MQKAIRTGAPGWMTIAAVAAFCLTAASYAVPIQVGTAITAHATETLSSSSASAGQTFQILAADPLLVQGWVVVVKGAIGQGHVVSVTRAPKDGKGPSVAVQFDWITAADGQHIPLTANKGKGPLVFGAEGPLAANFPKGKEVSVGPDLVFATYASTDRVVTVNAGG